MLGRVMLQIGDVAELIWQSQGGGRHLLLAGATSWLAGATCQWRAPSPGWRVPLGSMPSMPGISVLVDFALFCPENTRSTPALTILHVQVEPSEI